jgi:hypothetical protein
LLGLAFVVGCGSSTSGAPVVDAGDDDRGDDVGDDGADSGSRAGEGGAAREDGGDGGDASDASDAMISPTYPADRFATSEMYSEGACGGYGASELPGVVLGPPVGGGAYQGSLDVLSLGTGGSIVLGFTDTIVDGPGPDFLVFENPFLTNGQPDFELAQVSVSDDGTTWTSFPCTATGPSPSGYGTCAGWHPVYSSPTNGISPLDPAVAGGDPFDLALIGVTEARFVRITDIGVDYTTETCPAGSSAKTNGFDLDAVSIVNAGGSTMGTP